MLTALVIGVDGQDGSYLAELLLERGYQVVGWVPSNVPFSSRNIQHLLGQIILEEGDLRDQPLLKDLLQKYQPSEIYNLAAPSFPMASWENVVEVGDIAGLGTARLLEAMRLVCPQAHFYQASSSELFGEPLEVPQTESTPFRPRNPYGVAKLYAHWLTVRYRQRYGLYTVSGILYNHESPRRSQGFVTRKITRKAAEIKLGLEQKLHLGDLEARRDWGYAKDYVYAMWAMLQQDTPEDFVIGTGQTHSVREFCQLAFARLGLDYHQYIVQDPLYVRPSEAAQLVADASKARRQLGWQPSISFEQLVALMVDADFQELSSMHS